MDAKSEQKVINNLSKIVQETNGVDDKSLHSVKSDCNKKEKEAGVQLASMVIVSEYAYPMPLNAVPANSCDQTTDRDHLTSSAMDEKTEQNVNNDCSKNIQETKGADEKSLHSVKSGLSKKEKEGTIIHPDRNEHESHHISHDKVSPISAIKPPALHQQQHPSALYALAIRQLSPRLASPHEYSADSPIVANPYADQVQITIPGQIVELKSESSSLSSYHYKSDNIDMKQYQSTAAHQQTQLKMPYPSRGVLPSTTVHIDGRTSKPVHSPSSHISKKDSSHNQQIPPLHNPVNVKRPKTEHFNKEHSRTHLSHQESHKGSSISPGPVGMPGTSSPTPWYVKPYPHSSIPQSPRVILPNNEQSNRRINAQIVVTHSSAVRVNAPPPPAHAMSQSSNVPARTAPQRPSYTNQAPAHEDYLLRRYPIIWQGVLALKNAHVPVQMHFVSGNPNIARASLPPNINGEAQPVRIAQRMRLDPIQLDGVARKIQLMDEHCILMAWPCGKDQKDLLQQSDNLRFEFISYLLKKDAAGIVNAPALGTQQPSFVIHIFPTCDFIRNNISRIAPTLLQYVDETSHLWIVIGTI